MFGYERASTFTSALAIFWALQQQTLKGRPYGLRIVGVHDHPNSRVGQKLFDALGV